MGPPPACLEQTTSAATPTASPVQNEQELLFVFVPILFGGIQEGASNRGERQSWPAARARHSGGGLETH
eukprot:8853724-Pyramimonas_sp.AAC.1